MVFLNVGIIPYFSIRLYLCLVDVDDLHELNYVSKVLSRDERARALTLEAPK